MIFFVRALSLTCFPLAVALWASIVLHHALVLSTSPNQQAYCWTHLSLGLTPLLTKSTVDLSSQLPLPHYRPSITQTHTRLFHSICRPPFNPDHQSHHRPWSWFWMQLNCVSSTRRSGYSWLPHNIMHIVIQVSTHCHARQLDRSEEDPAYSQGSESAGSVSHSLHFSASEVALNTTKCKFDSCRGPTASLIDL